MGPKMPEADQKRQWCQSSEQLLEFFRCDPNDFLSRLVIMDETWLYRYDSETKQQSVEWRHSIAAHPVPKNSECKNLMGKFSPQFFGIKTASSSLIIFQRAKLSTWSITHLCWCNWRTFWRKNAAGRSLRGSCSCTTVPWLTGHLQPRRNWPTPTLFSGSGPVGLPSVPWTEKQLEGRHFSSDAEVIAAAKTWLDGTFFEWPAIVRATD